MDARDARRAGVAEMRSPDAREVASSTRGAVCRAGRSRGETTRHDSCARRDRRHAIESALVPNSTNDWALRFQRFVPPGRRAGGVSRDEPVPHTQPLTRGSSPSSPSLPTRPPRPARFERPLRFRVAAAHAQPEFVLRRRKIQRRFERYRLHVPLPRIPAQQFALRLCMAKAAQSPSSPFAGDSLYRARLGRRRVQRVDPSVALRRNLRLRRVYARPERVHRLPEHPRHLVREHRRRYTAFQGGSGDGGLFGSGRRTPPRRRSGRPPRVRASWV